MKSTILLLLGSGGFAGSIEAAPSIGTVRVAPTTVVVGTPTLVSVQASLTDPLLIPSSVNVLQLNPNGTTTVLGILHDDGLNGDRSAGDSIFTFAVTLNAPSVSQIQLQVSAAFRGILQRVRSPIVTVFFQPGNAPQLAIATMVQNLTAGNKTAVLNSVVASGKTAAALSAFNQQALNVLAGMLQAGVLVRSQGDLRVFQAPFVTPNGATTTVEFTMVPGPNGQWLINSW